MKKRNRKRGRTCLTCSSVYVPLQDCREENENKDERKKKKLNLQLGSMNTGTMVGKGPAHGGTLSRRTVLDDVLQEIVDALVVPPAQVGATGGLASIAVGGGHAQTPIGIDTAPPSPPAGDACADASGSPRTGTLLAATDPFSTEAVLWHWARPGGAHGRGGVRHGP